MTIKLLKTKLVPKAKQYLKYSHMPIFKCKSFNIWAKHWFLNGCPGSWGHIYPQCVKRLCVKTWFQIKTYNTELIGYNYEPTTFMFFIFYWDICINSFQKFIAILTCFSHCSWKCTPVIPDRVTLYINFSTDVSNCIKCLMMKVADCG